MTEPDQNSGTENQETGRLPDLAIESFARGFYREADSYGFGHVDYVRFFNAVLGMCMASDGTSSRTSSGKEQERLVLCEQLPLRNSTVQVRPFSPPTDTDLLLRWMQDPKGRMFLLAGTMTRWLTVDEIVNDQHSIVGLVTLPDGTPVGATAFLNIQRDQRKAEMRKLIGEPHMRGRGLAKAATRLWIGYGFGGLGLHKIYINTLDTNIRNIRLNEALGFQLEGILHDEVVLDGDRHDVLRMAIWRDSPSDA